MKTKSRKIYHRKYYAENKLKIKKSREALLKRKIEEMVQKRVADLSTG